MLRFWLRTLAAAALIAPATAAAQAPHPLDPLSAAEIETAVRLIRADPRCPADAVFPDLVRAQPSKEDVRAFREGQLAPRVALAVVYDRERDATVEARVDLRAGALASWTPRPGVHPTTYTAEFALGEQLVRADPRWQEAMRRRGITDFERVQVDVWAAGVAPQKAGGSGRLLRGISYLSAEGLNYYAHPIEGVTALIDIAQKRVLDVTDTGAVPVTSADAELDEASLGRRTGLRPLRVEQPEGTSFALAGKEVSWQKWRFRFALEPRDGLVLYTASYDDGSGAPRSVLYRGGLAEMLVPYFDGDANWRWRNAFDEGEYGIGRNSGPLSPERDAPANAVFIDATLADDFGKPYTIPRAVALYERDAGILWKHFDTDSQHSESRRARELVLLSVSTIGNYDYAVEWIFGQDASLRFEVGLTGIMLPKGVAATSAHDHGSSSGHLVAPNLAAPHHQHFFNVRLDLDVDGSANSVYETNVRMLPPEKGEDPANRVAMDETLLASERAAQRELSLESGRRWSVVNPERRNGFGAPTGFLLLPETNSAPFLHPQSSVRKRAAFVDHHLWVTRFKPDELYAAGPYPTQNPQSDGLPVYAGDDEPLAASDVVLWYTLGTTHLPRPEEWPVMPVHRIGFRLLPYGFLDRNPGLDVPDSGPPVPPPGAPAQN